MQISQPMSLLCVVALLSSCGAPPPDPAADLNTLFDETWEFELREFPTRATQVGVHDYNDQLASMLPADIERRAAYWQEVVERLDQIDPQQLADGDRINYEMFRRRLEDRIQEFGV